MAGEDKARHPETGATLNGVYYNESTRMFMAFSMGRLNMEFDGEGMSSEWKNKIKKTRSIRMKTQ